VISNYEVMKKSAKQIPKTLLSARKNKYNDILIRISLVVFVFILFFPSLRNGFVNWDDGSYLLENNTVHHLNFENLKTIFTTYSMGNYHPLTILLYALQYSVFGENSATPYHLFSLLLHLLNVMLIYTLLKLLTRNHIIAGICALWFGIHPMHAESVLWVSDQKELLYGCFFLLAMIAYYRYLRWQGLTGQAITRHGHKVTNYYLLTICLFLFSLLSKASAVVLPLVLFLMDFLFVRKLTRKMILEKIPFLLFSLIFGILAIFAQESVSAIRESTGQLFSPTERFFLVNSAFERYIAMFIYPAGLSPFHPYPVIHGEGLSMGIYLSPLLNLLILGLAVYSLRYSRKYFFGIFFFLTTIFIYLQVVPAGGAIIAERYSYIPYAGLLFITGVIISNAWNTKKFSNSVKVFILIFCFVITAGFSITTHSRIPVWKDGFSLWNNVIRNYPNDQIAIAYNNRGSIYFDRGIDDSAYSDYLHGMKLAQASSLLYGNLGTLYGKRNLLDSSLICLDKAISLDSFRYPLFYANRAKTYEGMGNHAKAIENFKMYLTFFPKDVSAIHTLGLCYQRNGQINDALVCFDKVLLLRPEDGYSYLYRADCYKLTGDKLKARQDIIRAQKLGATIPEEYLKILK